MERLIDRYEKKLVDQGLVLPGKAVLGELETELEWNGDDSSIPVLEKIFEELNISSLLFSEPAEPYKTIIDYLSEYSGDPIILKDNETRIFLHDIPVIRSFSSEEIIHKLKHRKCVIVKNYGIVTSSMVSPEQTFVNYSSVLFSCFVKFFADYLTNAMQNQITDSQRETFGTVKNFLPPFPLLNIQLKKSPFCVEEDVYAAVAEAGKPVVKHGFVDSVMGNISYRYKDTLYISQTGSFLDELEGYIDPCPLDNSSCTGITASSELPAHLAVVRDSSIRAVLHGHPKFSVIMSMICEKEKTCGFSSKCHIKCPESRFIGDIPIVPGETGSGPNALSNTVPQALKSNRGVIVYGHGVFTAGEDDFNHPFQSLCKIEEMCRDSYFMKVAEFS